MFSALLGEMNLVKDKCKLDGDLQQNELLKKDMEKISGYVTPYIPLVGLISGGVAIVAHVVDKAMFYPKGEEPQQSKEVTETTEQ